MITRVILITGGNGGLGQAIARGFLGEAADTLVWLGVRSNRSRAEVLAAEYPGRCRLVELEVTDPQSWKLAVAEITGANGRLDVLVNNAGG
ncbi:MAG TPA: SDR family NAD(P)-dependent oxidoreductase, partial [Candidatus Dormibacteraeota bacterium]|nr:SDR family NAD(P)-dependent oxidoreductase [Candidatus Dormibacteraeota bacterium]